MKRLMLFLILALLLAGCTTDGASTTAPTFTAPPLAVPAGTDTPAVPAVPPETAPTAEVLAPADATVLPEIVLDVTPQPMTTATLENLSRNCLNPGDWEAMVNRFLTQHDAEDLEELWEEFDADNPVYDLMSSLTDVTNEYAHATTNSKMLLVGEYKIAIDRPGAVGYAHCAVLIYIGGDNPEVGVGLTDATLNGTWSGFAYGNLHSEQEMRTFMRQRAGRPVLVRYQVSQDPRDVNFVRSGFFSPVMRLLWADSYFTRFSQNPDMLKDNVGQPRGPSIRELMELISAWPDSDVGVFIDYIIDPIL